MFPVSEIRRLLHHARRFCGRVFSSENDKETFCSKECVYEDAVRAPSGGHSGYRQKAHVRCSCGRTFLPQDDEDTFCSKLCAYEDGLRALSGGQSLYRQQYSENGTRSRVHQAFSADGTIAQTLHMPGVHGKPLRQLHPPSALVQLYTPPSQQSLFSAHIDAGAGIKRQTRKGFPAADKTPSSGKSVADLHPASVKHHVHPASVRATRDRSWDRELFAGNGFKVPGPLESHFDTMKRNVRKSTYMPSLPPANAILPLVGSPLPDLPSAQPLRIRRAGAIYVSKGTSPGHAQQGHSIQVSAREASLRVPFTSRSLQPMPPVDTFSYC